MIDTIARIKFWADLLADRRFTGSDIRVINVLLFRFMNVKTGRNQAYVAAIARLAGVSEPSVYRALKRLKELGFLRVIPTWGKQMKAAGGRWFRPRGASIYEWLHSFQTVKLTVQPKRKIIKEAQAALDPGLAAVLARFGNAVADKAGLPKVAFQV